jgi:hypothetical protein
MTTNQSRADALTGQHTHALMMAQTASCTCLTKTPEPQYHDAACRYRLLAEVIDFVERCSSQPAAAPCVHAADPKSCYRVRCQLGGKCIDDDLSPRSAPAPADERAAFVKLMGYDRPETEGVAVDVWDSQRTTWLEALAFARAASANETQTCLHQWTWADGKCADCGMIAQQPHAESGMTLAERIAHVGGRITEGGYVEFGSAMAVDALIQHVLRDARASANETGAEGELIERLKLLLSGDAAFCRTSVARSAIERAIAILSRAPTQAAEPAVIPIGYICADDLKQLAEGNGAIVSPRCRETDVPVFARAPAQAPEPAMILASWKLMPTSLTQAMRMTMADAAAAYMQSTGGNSPDVIYEAAIAAAPQPPAQAAKRVDAKARMDWAESILKNLPETEPTYSIIKLLNDYDQDERDEILQSIRAYADCRATQALFTQYSVAQADAREGLTDEQIEEAIYQHIPPKVALMNAKALHAMARALYPGQPEPRAEVTAADLAALLPGTYYMDPPDGGNVTLLEQLRRMAEDAARYRWLRDEDSGVPDGMGELYAVQFRLPHTEEPDRDLFGTELDAAIDAARAGEAS